MRMKDVVNHPSHYEGQSITFQPIDLCERFGFCIGNAVKYLIRAGKKEGVPEDQDLKKAKWYLNRFLSGQKTPEIAKDMLPADNASAFNAQRNRASAAVHAYCSVNIYVRTLFITGFPSVCTAGAEDCIKLIDNRLKELATDEIRKAMGSSNIEKLLTVRTNEIQK